MMSSPAMKIVGMVVWVLTALAAISIGLKPFGYDLGMNMMISYPSLVAPVQYLLLASGVASLVMLFVGCGCGAHCKCK